MTDFPDMIEIQHLQDMLEYLPMNPSDEENIAVYTQNITNLIAVNYKYEQYQFSYFGFHLLFMTYIYCTIWKISQIIPDRYYDAITFARPYNGKEKDLKIDAVKSIFEYSLVPEKDIGKLFKIIDLDTSQIDKLASLVRVRDNMAHASGKFEILTEDIWDTKLREIMSSVKNIHRSMEKLIRRWYSQLLLDFCAGKYKDNYNEDDVADFITEQIIQDFKLSIKELFVCNEMSITDMIAEHMENRAKLKNFKEDFNIFCKDMGYL